MHSNRYSVADKNDSINIGLSETVHEIFSDPIMHESSDLDVLAKKKYIEIFLKKGISESLGYTDIESLYQRIDCIPNLNFITNQPVYLMMTLYVLPFLEDFYAFKKQIYHPSEIVQKDILHLFTENVIKSEAEKIYSETGVISIGRTSVTECILGYTRALAKAMCHSDYTLSDISESELYTTDCNSTLRTQLTEQQINSLKKFFSNDINLYKNEDEYLSYKTGREGCIFLKREGLAGEFQYSFIHNIFIDYFMSLIPQTINGRRREIASFLRGSIKKSLVSNLEISSELKEDHNKIEDIKETINAEKLRQSSPSNKKGIFSVITPPARRIEDIKTNVDEHNKKVAETFAKQSEFIANNPGKSTSFYSSFTGLSVSLFSKEDWQALIAKERENQQVDKTKSEDSIKDQQISISASISNNK